MADKVTKNPMLASDALIQQENDRRKKSIEKFLKMPPQQIRPAIRCTLTSLVGRPVTPPAGERLYVLEKWLVRPADVEELRSLVWTKFNLEYDWNPYLPRSYPRRRNLSEQTKERIKEIERKLEAIYSRGSDHLRASVARAANWACVPPELLAAVLQNENSPKATDRQRHLQSLERSLQSLLGIGSTGFGNVKPETLKRVTALFQKYYKSNILEPGVMNVGQHKNAETDIYHSAAVLRDGLNKAWSAGPRSLNVALSKKYTYYPYFGGMITADVAIRAMGHYNGMGDDALEYGKFGMYRIQKQKLYFLPPK